MKRNLKYLLVLLISAPIIHFFALVLVAALIYADRKRDQRKLG